MGATNSIKPNYVIQDLAFSWLTIQFCYWFSVLFLVPRGKILIHEFEWGKSIYCIIAFKRTVFGYKKFKRDLYQSCRTCDLHEDNHDDTLFFLINTHFIFHIFLQSCSHKLEIRRHVALQLQSKFWSLHYPSLLYIAIIDWKKKKKTN